MLYEIYYKLSSVIYRKKMNIGKNPKMKLGATVIGGKYIHCGDNVILGKNTVLAVYPEHCGKVNPAKTRKDGGIYFGNRVSGNRGLTVYCAEKVEIGDDVLFGSNILVTDNNHGMDPEGPQYIDQPLTTKETKIGNGCWIGEQVCILAGSDIGERSIIAAGSIVTGKIPAYSIAVGAPARVIKKWDFDSKQWVKA